MKAAIIKNETNYFLKKTDMRMPFRRLVLIFIIICISGYSSFGTTYYSRTSGNWSSNSTWSTVACSGTSASSYPVAGDIVYICSGHTVTVNVASACATLDITGTLTIGAYSFTVSGATTISGTMNDNNSSGTNSFGDITINGGTFNNTGNAAFTINGNFQNNNTFSPGTGVFTFAGTSKTISGTVTIPSATINGTYTNNGTLTVNTALSGSGTLTQGTSGILNIGGSSGITNLAATASPNTVSYTSTSGAQTVRAITYHHLTINKSGQTATLGGAVTVNGNLAISAGTLADGGYQITGNGTGTFSMASGTTLTLGTAATATSFPTAFTNANISFNAASTVNYNSNVAQTISNTPAYGNLTLTASGAVTKTAAGALVINGTLTVGASNTLADGGYTITVKGNVANNGTHSGAGKIYLNGGSGSHTLSGGTSAFGNLELSDANGATWSGTGTTTVNGTLTVTAGTLATGSFTTGLSVTGNTGISGTLSTTSTTGTKIYGNITVNNGGTWNVTVAEAFTINGNIQNDGIFTSNTGVYTLAGSGKTLSGNNDVTIASATIGGSYTNNGVFTVSTALAGGGTIIQGTNSTLNVGGTFTTTTTTLTASGNTVVYMGTSGSQTIKGTTYNDLVIDKSTQTGSLGGATTVNGDLYVTSGTLSLATTNINVSGATIVDGTLTVPGNIGVNYFTGSVSISNGATWTSTALTNAANLVFKGGIANAGTFNAGAATFNTNSQVISGSGAMSFANDVTISGAITYTNTNSAGLTVNGNLNGSVAGSAFINQGSFNYGGTNSPMVTGTFTVNSNPNTFSYTSTSSAQTVKITTYHHLTINKAGQTATLGGAVTINGNLTITAGTLADGGYLITGNGTGILSIASGATLTLGTAATATSLPTNYTPANISLNAASTVNYNSNVAQTILSTVTYGNLTLTASSAVTKTAGGNITANGTLTVGSNNTFAPAGNTITAANAVINGAVTNTGTFTISNALSGSGTFTQGTNSTLNIGGGNTITTLTATANPNTVVYTGASGAQTIFATTYHNLTINSSGQVATLSSTLTVNNNLSLAAGTFQFGTASAYTLTVAGVLTVNSGATLQSHQSSVSKRHTLALTGSLTNNGTVKFRYDADDYVAITFQGSGTSTVSGSGSWTSLAYATMNKSAKTDEVYINSTGFGTALTSGADILASPQLLHKNPPVIFTRGTFRYDIADNLSNLIDAGATGGPTFTLNSNVKIRVDQGTVDLATYSGIGSNGFCEFSGNLEINGGKVTISKNTNTDQNAGIQYTGSPTPSLTITGGSLDCYGSFAVQSTLSESIAFTMSGGTFTLNMGPTATDRSTFWISDNAASSVIFTGGTIVIQQKSTYGLSIPNIDFYIGGSSNSTHIISGSATVQFGNAATPSSQTMRFNADPNVVYPNVVVYNPGGGKTVTVAPYNSADFKFLSLVINSGQVFDNRDISTSTDNHTMTIMSDNGTYSFYNDGTFNYRTGTVTYDGNSSQIIGGSNATFYKLNFQNDAKLLVNASANNTLTANAVINLNTKTLTLGTSAANPGTLVYVSGRFHTGTFTRWFGTSAISNGHVNGLFPMGDTVNYRPYFLSDPSGISAGGSVSIRHNPAVGGTPVTIVDGGYTVLTRHNAYWTSSYTGFTGVSGTPFNLLAGAAGMGEVTNINDLRVTRINDVVGTAGTNSGTITEPRVLRTGLTLAQLNNNFYIGTINNTTSPLPIQLLCFDAKPENNSVKLNWTTATETNNDFFTIERSKDLNGFEELINIKGAGNSNQLINYSAVDAIPYHGVSYYRLKQTDFNGAYKYSDAVDVLFKKEIAFSVFPNPSDGSSLFIQFEQEIKNEDISVIIFDINANLTFLSNEFVNSPLENNVYLVKLKERPRPGLYIVKVTAGTESNKRELIIR
jgi:hypothetical protein